MFNLKLNFFLLGCILFDGIAFLPITCYPIFEIYRKPGSTDAIIPANSYHNHQHKMAAFRSLIHRLVTLPLTKAGYRKELNTILKIAENNGYEKQAILRMLRKMKETLENRTLFNGTMEDTKWITIPYNGVISEEIQKTVQEGNKHKITFSNKPNLGMVLINTKNQKKDIMDCSGVYQINCKCGMAYVGQTGRKIGTRVKEHLASGPIIEI